MSNVYKVPILLILFNRPKYTLKTIQFLNMIKPEVLYVHIDGPRDQEDQDRIDEVELMLNDLHPDINVTFKKSDSNLGCGLGPVSAINWFFENEDYGIIFEDDLVPDKSFFEYCEILLKKYRDKKNIFMISGDNGGPMVHSDLFENHKIMAIDIPLIWGWATWSDRWEKYKFELEKINFISTFKNLKNFYFFERIMVINYFLRATKKSFIDTWDIQLFYMLIMDNNQCLIPSVNLVKNIGFDDDATHTKEIISRSFSDTHEIKITEHNYIKSNKSINSRMIYLITTQMNSKQVYSNFLISLRINYMYRRYMYYFNSLKSKINKTLSRKS